MVIFIVDNFVLIPSGSGCLFDTELLSKVIFFYIPYLFCADYGYIDGVVHALRHLMLVYFNLTGLCGYI